MVRWLPKAPASINSARTQPDGASRVTSSATVPAPHISGLSLRVELEWPKSGDAYTTSEHVRGHVIVRDDDFETHGCDGPRQFRIGSLLLEVFVESRTFESELRWLERAGATEIERQDWHHLPILASDLLPGSFSSIVTIDPEHGHRIPFELVIPARASGWRERHAEPTGQSTSLPPSFCESSRAAVEYIAQVSLELDDGADLALTRSRASRAPSSAPTAHRDDPWHPSVRTSRIKKLLKRIEATEDGLLRPTDLRVVHRQTFPVAPADDHMPLLDVSNRTFASSSKQARLAGAVLEQEDARLTLRKAFNVVTGSMNLNLGELHAEVTLQHSRFTRSQICPQMRVSLRFEGSRSVLASWKKLRVRSFNVAFDSVHFTASDTHNHASKPERQMLRRLELPVDNVTLGRCATEEVAMSLDVDLSTRQHPHARKTGRPVNTDLSDLVPSFATNNIEVEYVMFLSLHIDSTAGLNHIGPMPIQLVAGIAAPVSTPPQLDDPPAWTLQDVAPPYADERS